jgi:hypothetical protein
MSNDFCELSNASAVLPTARKAQLRLAYATLNSGNFRSSGQSRRGLPRSGGRNKILRTKCGNFDKSVVPTDGAYIIVLTEMMPSNAPAEESENQTEEKSSNKRMRRIRLVSVRKI